MSWPLPDIDLNKPEKVCEYCDKVFSSCGCYMIQCEDCGYDHPEDVWTGICTNCGYNESEED